MEALVSPCSKGASGGSWTGDPSYLNFRGGGAPPPRWLFHVASTRGLGGFSPIFLRRRAVILPAFPRPLCYASSHTSSLMATAPEEDGEGKATEMGTRIPSELRTVTEETEKTEVQTQTPSASPKATRAETEPTKVRTEIAVESPEAEAETTKHRTPVKYESTTVRVKFKLQKFCQFGEQFLLVGEGPLFGFWDTTAAIPLEWMAGHVWMGELDLPVGEEIKFKFVLRGLSGEIKWQPGPDRVLRTWETTNTIVAEYGWEKTEDQEIAEEGPWAIPEVEEASAQCEMGAEGETVEEQTDAEHGNNLEIAGDKHVGHTGIPVPVPGLAPLATSSADSASPLEVVNGPIDYVFIASGEINDEISEDAPGKLDGMLLEDENQQEAVSSTGGQLDETNSQPAAGCASEEGSDPQPAVNAVGDGIHWGRQTFQKFLMTLGLFRQEPT